MHLVTSLAIHNNFFSLLQVYNFQEITGAILLLLGITHVLIICTNEGTFEGVRFRIIIVQVQLIRIYSALQ